MKDCGAPACFFLAVSQSTAGNTARLSTSKLLHYCVDALSSTPVGFFLASGKSEACSTRVLFKEGRLPFFLFLIASSGRAEGGKR